RERGRNLVAVRDPAGRVDDDRGFERLHVVGARHRVLGVERPVVVGAGAGGALHQHERLGVVERIDAQGQDLDAARAVLFVHPREGLELRDALAAAAGREQQHHGLAALLGEGEGLPVQRPDGEVGRRRTGRLRGGGSRRRPGARGRRRGRLGLRGGGPRGDRARRRGGRGRGHPAAGGGRTRFGLGARPGDPRRRWLGGRRGGGGWRGRWRGHGRGGEARVLGRRGRGGRGRR